MLNVVGTSNQKKGPLNILRHLLHYNGILKTCANIQICFLPLFVIGFCLILKKWCWCIICAHFYGKLQKIVECQFLLQRLSCISGTVFYLIS